MDGIDQGGMTDSATYNSYYLIVVKRGRGLEDGRVWHEGDLGAGAGRCGSRRLDCR